MSANEYDTELSQDEQEDTLLNSPGFKMGVDVGQSFGEQKAYDEIRKAYAEKGVTGVEAWLERKRPKTMEEWDEYYEAHPEEWTKPYPRRAGVLSRKRRGYQKE